MHDDFHSHQVIKILKEKKPVLCFTFSLQITLYTIRITPKPANYSNKLLAMNRPHSLTLASKLPYENYSWIRRNRHVYHATA